MEGEGVKGKRDETRGANGEKEVAIFIGLVEWNESHDCLKRKHGKRMALKVKKDDPPVVLLQKAMEKWKVYFSNCYDENEDYVLLLEDFKEATFLPGSTKEFFTLDWYQQELGKDFKRITLFLCTQKEEVNMDAGQKHDVTNEHQVNDDFQIAQAIQASLDNGFRDSTQELMTDTLITYNDHTSVTEALEQRVLTTEQFFLVVRRGIPFDRVISLWQRGREIS